MAEARSAKLTTFGVLHLVGGALGLLLTLCAGLGLMVQRNVPAGAGPKDLAARAREVQIAKVPGFEAVEAGTVGLWLLLDLMLLVGGVGLLTRQGWARWAAVAYAVLSVLLKLFLIVYYTAFVYPPVNAFVQEQARFTPQGQQPGFIAGYLVGFFGSSVCLPLVLLIYPVAVLVAFLPPSAAEAFAPPRRSRRRRDEDPDDYDDRPRRRRVDDYDEDDEDDRLQPRR